MPKKKVTSKHYKGFLTVMDYFATGEGRTLELNFCLVDTEKEAKQKHIDRFYGTNQSAGNYFGAGVEVMKIESKKAQKIIEGMFLFGQSLHKDLCKAGIEFHFKVHCNYS